MISCNTGVPHAKAAQAARTAGNITPQRRDGLRGFPDGNGTKP